MRHLMDLGLIGLLMTTSERPNKETNPSLMKMVDNLGYNEYWDYTYEELRAEAFQVIDAAERHFDYFDKSDLEVNALTDAFLTRVYDELSGGFKEDLRTVAITVCALGNKNPNGLPNCTEGVETWIKFAKAQLEELRKRFETGEEVDYLPLLIGRLEYADNILGVVDVFVTAHKGMLMGVEEFAPGDYQDVFPIEDWVSGNECNQTTECECGCTLNKPIAILQGMEDYLSGKTTKATMYLENLCYSNDMRLRSVAGNEEGVWDTVKEIGAKAYEWCKEVLDSFMELFDSGKSDEEIAAAEDDAEINKKALQAITDKTMRVKPAAKQGAIALATKNDTTGKVAKALTSLNTIGDGARVITALQAILTTELKKEGKLGTKLEAAKKAVADLQSTTAKATSGSGDNKEVVKNAKTSVDEKVKAAKDSLKEVKAAASAQKKIVTCIRRTIKGITPKIFMDKENKTPVTSSTAPAPKEPAAKPAKA